MLLHVNYFCQQGFPCEKPLGSKESRANNWKKVKRAWDNYTIIVRLDRRDFFKIGTFPSCIGDDALKIDAGIDFSTEEECTKLNVVVKKFQQLCLGKANETYERFIFCNIQRRKRRKWISISQRCVDWDKQAIFFNGKLDSLRD